MYYNVKRLFAPLIFPSLLIILSMLIGWQWDRMLFHADIDNELTAFILISPLIPYVLFVIVIILGARSNNSGLILCTIILTISYFILEVTADTGSTYRTDLSIDGEVTFDINFDLGLEGKEPLIISGNLFIFLILCFW